MKKTIALLIAAGLACTAWALNKAEVDKRAQKLLDKFERLQQDPGKRIPAETLRKAHGIVLLDRTKAGFIFAYQGGAGMAMVKDKKSNQWGPLAFYKADEASLGFQIGGQQSFLVLLLMTNDAARLLTEQTLDFGGEARGTAGASSAGAEGIVGPEEPALLTYNDRTGLFGGAAIKGGALTPDDAANSTYYGEYHSTRQILFEKKVSPTPLAKTFAAKIAEYSKK
jgi:SH3 domain-containing YSC84-like protein 1